MKIDAASEYFKIMNQQININENKVDFGEMMKDYLGEINELQRISDESTTSLIAGTAENVHDIMIASEEARLALELTVQMRNKIIEAYQELIRIQI